MSHATLDELPSVLPQGISVRNTFLEFTEEDRCDEDDPWIIDAELRRQKSDSIVECSLRRHDVQSELRSKVVSLFPGPLCRLSAQRAQEDERVVPPLGVPPHLHAAPHPGPYNLCADESAETGSWAASSEASSPWSCENPRAASDLPITDTLMPCQVASHSLSAAAVEQLDGSAIDVVWPAPELEAEEPAEAREYEFSSAGATQSHGTLSSQGPISMELGCDTGESCDEHTLTPCPASSLQSASKSSFPSWNTKVGWQAPAAAATEQPQGKAKEPRADDGASGQAESDSKVGPGVGKEGVSAEILSARAVAASGGGLSGFTTIMMKNVPTKYSQYKLMREINFHGYMNKFDFIYLPTDSRSQANRGFAFMNFTSSEAAEAFYTQFNGSRLKSYWAEKVLAIYPADVQGFERNAMHYASLMPTQRRTHQSKPLFFRPIPAHIDGVAQNGPSLVAEGSEDPSRPSSAWGAGSGDGQPPPRGKGSKSFAQKASSSGEDGAGFASASGGAPQGISSDRFYQPQQLHQQHQQQNQTRQQRQQQHQQHHQQHHQQQHQQQRYQQRQHFHHQPPQHHHQQPQQQRQQQRQQPFQQQQHMLQQQMLQREAQRHMDELQLNDQPHMDELQLNDFMHQASMDQAPQQQCHNGQQMHHGFRNRSTERLRLFCSYCGGRCQPADNFCSYCGCSV